MSQTTVEETVLSYREGASDKVYQMQLVEVSPGAFQVQVQYGRRGATLASLSKPPQPTTQENTVPSGPPLTTANAIGMPKLKATPSTACGMETCRLAYG